MVWKILIVTALLSLSGLPAASPQERDPRPTSWDGTIEVVAFGNPEIRESSGLALSGRREDVLWTLNDSGNGPFLYAVGPKGEDLGRVEVKGAVNRDWEDLASFRWENRPFLLIADVGDNRRGRHHCTLYGVEEPTLQGGRLPDGAGVPAAWVMDFRYEDGARNCEAVSVDAAGGQVLLVTKDDVPPRLYALPLAFSAKSGMPLARFITTLPRISEPAPGDRKGSGFGPLGRKPTGMDLSRDGSLAVILTYEGAHVFRRGGGKDWGSVLRGRSRFLGLAGVSQAEAVCFSGDGKRIFISSER